jgi:hypothetical protein
VLQWWNNHVTTPFQALEDQHEIQLTPRTATEPDRLLRQRTALARDVPMTESL